MLDFANKRKNTQTVISLPSSETAQITQKSRNHDLLSFNFLKAVEEKDLLIFWDTLQCMLQEMFGIICARKEVPKLWDGHGYSRERQKNVDQLSLSERLMNKSRI